MRKLLLLVVLLALPALANSMFDLFPGTWHGTVGQSQSLTVKIGDAQTRSMQWIYADGGKTVTITGYYKVTAVKDSHHTSFTVGSLLPDSDTLTVGQLTVKKGQVVPLILKFNGNGMDMTAFDSDSQPVITCSLQKE